MPISTPLALLIGAGVSGGAALGGAALSSSAAGSAAGAQAGAATTAAQLQSSDAQKALDFQKQVYEQTQANQAPWLKSGTGAIQNLSDLLGLSTPPATGGPLPTGREPAGIGTPVVPSGVGIAGPGQNLAGAAPPGGVGMPPAAGGAPGSTPLAPTGTGSLLTPWTTPFTAPTNLTEQNDPGFQARLALGQQALENSAAARGGLLSGGTARGLNQYAQDYASNEYGNVYNRALGQYQQNYNIFQQNQANQFNRLASIAGVGQTTAANLGQAGQTAATNVGNINLASGQQIGQSIQNVAAANASGYVGAANAYSGALGGFGNNFSDMLLLSQLLKNQGTVNPNSLGVTNAASSGLPIGG